MAEILGFDRIRRPRRPERPSEASAALRGAASQHTNMTAGDFHSPRAIINGLVYGLLSWATIYLIWWFAFAPLAFP
jgi:hypothetical protein